MDLLELLGALPDAARPRWYAMAVALLLVVMLGLWVEARWFARSGRAGSWAVLRTISLFAAPLTVASVALPVMAASGPMGLVVMYGALLTVAPLIWFGTHGLVGPRLRPALSRGESVALSLSGLALLLVLPGAAWQMAHAALEAEVRAIGPIPVRSDDSAPLAHQPGPAQRWQLPGQHELWTQSLQAPNGIRLERVERFAAGRWHSTADRSAWGFCWQAENLHLAWSPDGPPPVWRLHWVDDAGRTQRSVFQADASAFQKAVAQPFSVAFRSDGFDLPAPLARSGVHVAPGRLADGAWRWVALTNVATPGAPARDTCLMAGVSQPPTPQQPAIQAVGLRLDLPGQPSAFMVFERPLN